MPKVMPKVIPHATPGATPNAMPKVKARPYDYPFDPAQTAVLMIDMQRDFLEPGGFGAMLGNDVSRLQPIVPACRTLLALARRHGMKVVHTQEAHDPQLADCPPSKRARGGLVCGSISTLKRAVARSS